LQLKKVKIKMEIKFSFFASETLGVNTNGKETGAISLSFGQMN
tara:strand:- start:694 stop:822 length:129 start_codon:yes stop_codon:yes gene_type:complete